MELRVFGATQSLPSLLLVFFFLSSFFLVFAFASFVMSLSFAINPTLRGLISPDTTQSFLSFSPSGLFKPVASTTTYPNQFSGMSPLHPTDLQNSKDFIFLSPEEKSKEIQKEFLANLLSLNFGPNNSSPDATVVTSPAKYTLAADSPTIAGFLAVVQLDSAPTTDPSKLSSKIPPPSGPYLVVLGPTAFAFNGKGLQAHVFSDTPQKISSSQFRFPTTLIAPAFAFQSGIRPQSISQLNPYSWITSHPSSILASLRAHRALFSTVILEQSTSRLHSPDDPWHSLWIPSQDSPPHAHQIFSRLHRVDEPILTIQVENTSPIEGSWIALSALPLPRHHHLPIGLLFDPASIPDSASLINAILGWNQTYNPMPATRSSHLKDLATTLSWLDVPFVNDWLLTVSQRADDFATVWHTSKQIAADLTTLKNVPISTNLPRSYPARIHPYEALFVHPFFSLTTKLFSDALLQNNPSHTMRTKFFTFFREKANMLSSQDVDLFLPQNIPHVDNTHTYVPFLFRPQTQSWSTSYGFKSFSSFDVQKYLPDFLNHLPNDHLAQRVISTPHDRSPSSSLNPPQPNTVTRLNVDSPDKPSQKNPPSSPQTPEVRPFPLEPPAESLPRRPTAFHPPTARIPSPAALDPSPRFPAPVPVSRAPLQPQQMEPPQRAPPTPQQLEPQQPPPQPHQNRLLVGPDPPPFPTQNLIQQLPPRPPSRQEHFLPPLPPPRLQRSPSTSTANAYSNASPHAPHNPPRRPTHYHPASPAMESYHSQSFNPLAHQRQAWDAPLVSTTTSPWYLPVDNPTWFTSTRLKYVHSTLASSAYLPLIRRTMEERGQFTFDRFIFQDTDQLPPHVVQWAFLGIVALPTDLRLVDPNLPTTTRRPSYSHELLHTPSHLNNDWLRQVLPYAGADHRSSAAEVAAIDLLAAAIEASKYPVAPFRVDFSQSFLHAEAPRKALRTFRINAGQTLHLDDPKSLYLSLTPWHFLWSIPLSPEGRLPQQGLSCTQFKLFFHHIVFFLNTVLTNDDSFPQFPPGFSPFLLRGPLAGQLLWAAHQFDQAQTRDAWSTLASSQPSHTLQLSQALLHHTCDLFQQFLRWGAQNRTKIACPATADPEGFVPQCTLIYDVSPHSTDSNLTYCLDWRSTFTLLFTAPTILSHQHTNSMSPLFCRSTPNYLLPSRPDHRGDSRSPLERYDRAQRRRSPSDRPPDRATDQPPPKRARSDSAQPQRRPGQKALVPLVTLTAAGKERYTHSGKLLADLASSLTIPRFDQKQYCFMYIDKNSVVGCTGPHRSRTNSEGQPLQCNRHHVCLSPQAISNWPQSSLKPLWEFCHHDRVRHLLQPTPEFAAHMASDRPNRPNAPQQPPPSS